MEMISYVQVEMCEWSGHNVRVNMECASNVRVIGYVRVKRVIGYVRVKMCEWSGHNVRVNMECASTVMCA